MGERVCRMCVRMRGHGFPHNTVWYHYLFPSFFLRQLYIPFQSRRREGTETVSVRPKETRRDAEAVGEASCFGCFRRRGDRTKERGSDAKEERGSHAADSSTVALRSTQSSIHIFLVQWTAILQYFFYLQTEKSLATFIYADHLLIAACLGFAQYSSKYTLLLSTTECDRRSEFSRFDWIKAVEQWLRWYRYRLQLRHK